MAQMQIQYFKPIGIFVASLLAAACEEALDHEQRQNSDISVRATALSHEQTTTLNANRADEATPIEPRTGLPIESMDETNAPEALATTESSPPCYNDTAWETEQSSLEPSISPDEQARYLDERETAVALAMEHWDDGWGDSEVILRDLQLVDDRRWQTDGDLSGNRDIRVSDRDMIGHETDSELARSERKLHRLAAEQNATESLRTSEFEEFP
jgi:hypothetical protein